jgi:hypothetical protein
LRYAVISVEKAGKAVHTLEAHYIQETVDYPAHRTQLSVAQERREVEL